MATVLLAETDKLRLILNYTLVSPDSCKQAMLVRERLASSSSVCHPYFRSLPEGVSRLLGLSDVSNVLTGPNVRIAYFCIEQGPRLEARNHKIGIVQGVCCGLLHSHDHYSLTAANVGTSIPMAHYHSQGSRLSYRNHRFRESFRCNAHRS